MDIAHIIADVGIVELIGLFAVGGLFIYGMFFVKHNKGGKSDEE